MMTRTSGNPVKYCRYPTAPCVRAMANPTLWGCSERGSGRYMLAAMEDQTPVRATANM